MGEGGLNTEGQKMPDKPKVVNLGLEELQKVIKNLSKNVLKLNRGFRNQACEFDHLRSRISSFGKCAATSHEFQKMDEFWLFCSKCSDVRKILTLKKESGEEEETHVQGS